jgi:hypothetical protein
MLPRKTSDWRFGWVVNSLMVWRFCRGNVKILLELTFLWTFCTFIFICWPYLFAEISFKVLLPLKLWKICRKYFRRYFYPSFMQFPYQTDRYVTDICHSSVKYLQNICMKVSVTYLQHIGIWPHNISVSVMWHIYVTVMWQISVTVIWQISVTYLQHIGIWPINISVTVMWQYSFPTDKIICILSTKQICNITATKWDLSLA